MDVTCLKLQVVNWFQQHGQLAIYCAGGGDKKGEICTVEQVTISG
jgi:hypothetical protein